MFLMSISINWNNFIVWLSLLFEILGNINIAVICFPGCDVINFEINLIILMKPYMIKNSRHDLNILRMNRAFKVKLKAFFITFKGLSIVKNCLRPESVALNNPIAELLIFWSNLIITNSNLIVTSQMTRIKIN